MPKRKRAGGPDHPPVRPRARAGSAPGPGGHRGAGGRTGRRASPPPAAVSRGRPPRPHPRLRQVSAARPEAFPVRAGHATRGPGRARRRARSPRTARQGRSRRGHKGRTTERRATRRQPRWERAASSPQQAPGPARRPGGHPGRRARPGAGGGTRGPQLEAGAAPPSKQRLPPGTSLA